MTPPLAALPADWMLRTDCRAAAEELFDVSVREVDTDRARVVQDVGPVPAWSLGRLGVLVDAAGGRPLAARLAEGLRCSTVAMHLELLRPPTPADGPELTATGELLDGGIGWPVSRIAVRGAAPGPLAVGTVRFLVVAAEAPALAAAPGAGSVPATAGSGAPPTGNGRPAADPADDPVTTLDLRVRPAPPGHAELVFRPGAPHSNPYAIVHGGVNVALVDAAMTTAAATAGAAPPGAEPLVLLGVDLAFHRPIPVDGEPVSVTAEVLHHGRTAVLAEATVRAASGKPLTTARGTLGRVGVAS